MTLVYAFSNQWGTNISRRTLLDLQQLLPPSNNLNYQIIRYHPKHFYNKYINNSHWSSILGLGDFFGNTSKIRIETTARNIYGDNTIYPFAPTVLELNLPQLDLVDNRLFSVSENMGTYNCNWMAFRTQLYINQHSPHTRQMFLHLPKKGQSSVLSRHIRDLLLNNQVLQ